MLDIVTVENHGTDLDTIRRLFRDYERELNEDICFQSFEKELEDPLLKYGTPLGSLLLAFWDGEPAGCVAYTTIGDGVAEMKRLYVPEPFRLKQVGRALADAIIAKALKDGFHVMRLDTLDRLVPALHLYEKLGFSRIEPYYANPLQGVVYMELLLSS